MNTSPTFRATTPVVLRFRSVCIPVALTALMVALVAIGCGSSGGETSDAAKVSDGGRVHSPADLPAIGFKESKTYSVEGLPGATDSIFGFWRAPGADPVDYEVRFYRSHADAVALGQLPAEEGTGDDAALNADDATYKEGVQDRRVIIGGGVGGGARSGIGPKYGDFAVIDNLVVLCAGGESSQSLERCRLLADALREIPGPR